MDYLQFIPCSTNPYLHHRGIQNSKSSITVNQRMKDCPESSSQHGGGYQNTRPYFFDLPTVSQGSSLCTQKSVLESKTEQKSNVSCASRLQARKKRWCMTHISWVLRDFFYFFNCCGVYMMTTQIATLIATARLQAIT